MAIAGDRTDQVQEFTKEEGNERGASGSAQANRRAFPRYAVDCAATIIPVSGAAAMSGRLSDLSMGGCLVQLPERYRAGTLMRVEVQFQLRGVAFRVIGVTAGTRGAKSFAVRFVDLPARRRDELAELLEEVAAIHAAKAVAPPEKAAEVEAASMAEAMPPVSVAAEVETVPAAEPAPSTVPKGAPSARDRRAHGRHEVDTHARLLLVKSGISMTGRILNLSMGGCRLRTDERFNVGIFVRVETEFYLHGLPFRIGGVSQAIQDKNMIGVRFLDMSERRREQLLELIAEMEQAQVLEPDKPEA